jgi:hypothetical protein
MSSIFLTGPAGTGKTTYAIEKIQQLLASHVPAADILVIVPHLALAQPYRTALPKSDLPGAGDIEVISLSGLALKMLDLFWPLIARPAGFGRPEARPIFLTIETAQYYLQQAIEPLLRQGYFDPNVVPVTISLSRLMVQILENLNKAAMLGLPYTQVAERLAASLPNDPGRRVGLEHTQACINRFREFCLEHNLLDFSLRIETFYQHLWPVAGVNQFLTRRYRHLIVDNIEEDSTFTHAILREWLPLTESALLINDEDAGFRTFLGANWRTAQALAETCDETIRMDSSYVASEAMLEFGQRIARVLVGKRPDSPLNGQLNGADQPVKQKPGQAKLTTPPPFTFEQKQLYPQMIEWVIDQVINLVEQGTPPAEIAIISPFVSDALRFTLSHRLAQRGLTIQSHRPSRPLSEEPPAKAMLVLARLAFPHWELWPEPIDVAQTLAQVISDLDLIRANLLTQVVYRPGTRTGEVLTPFAYIEGAVRERISDEIGVRFDQLRGWLQDIQANRPPNLDHFFSRLFGEVLSQPGFNFHEQAEAGQVVANLIDSARAFRQVVEQVPLNGQLHGPDQPIFPTVDQINRAYLETVEQGVTAGLYLRSWEPAPDDSILIIPASIFVMNNRVVDYQFWLDAGSNGWWENITQPLTHPYVLAADWEPGRLWTDADEVAAQHDRLYRLILGLTRRCRKHIFITNAETGEQGYEQRGPLLMVLQRTLRQAQKESEVQ